MRLTITIDGASHTIDSTDPELLGKWVVEIFARVGQVTPATYIQVQAYPSYLPSHNGEPVGLDWIADSRIIGGVFRISSPRELVEGLARQLDDADQLHGRGAGR
jgi:hypothetical protein